VVVALGVLLAVGCSRKDDKPVETKTLVLGRGRTIPTGVPAVPEDQSPPVPVAEPHVAFESQPNAPVMYTVKVAQDGGSKPVDPDLLIIDSARKSASGCFTNITDGSTARFASIQVVVVPSGQVTRSNVSAPGTTEPWILSCLDDVASGLHFSDKSDKPNADVRNLTISVSVSRPH
jgi:hypothetical protein